MDVTDASLQPILILLVAAVLVILAMAFVNEPAAAEIRLLQG